MKVADRLQLAPAQRAEVYYTSLLMHTGCTAGSVQIAAYLASDELVAQRDFCLCDPGNSREVMSWLWSHTSPTAPAPARSMRFLSNLMQGDRAMAEVERGCSDVGATIAGRLRLTEATRLSLFHICETWGGKGPHKLRGEAIPLPTRIVTAAMIFEVFLASAGLDAALQAVAKRRAKSLDPQVVDALQQMSGDTAFWQTVKSEHLWISILELEPLPVRLIGDRDLDNVSSALADFVDLKNVRIAAHSREVARLAEAIARRMRLPESDVDTARRAALVHALGQVSVPAYVLSKASSLTPEETEKLRLHPYFTERITARSPSLQQVGRIGAMHHERLDGKGYPLGLSGEQIPTVARIVAVADAYEEALEQRPGKPAVAGAEAFRELHAGSGTRFDPRCIEVLAQEVGVPRPTTTVRQEWPAGLTVREVEVLALAARGLTTKEMAKALVISESTARHHLEHIYDKVGATSRAGAVMFAAENGLIH